MANIGFVGLGNIGKGICKNLIEAGNALTVFDVNKSAMERFAGRAVLAKDLKEICSNSEYIFLSLPNSQVVEDAVDTFIKEGVENKVIIDTSTSYPVSTRQLYEKVKANGGSLIDAPLMTGPQEAEEGTLDIVIGGDKEVVDSLSFLFESYCKSYRYVGGIGNGHLAKLAINFCGLSEALLFAQLYPVMAKFGFKQEELYDILNCETLDNWVFQFYSDKYVKKDYRLDFALALGLKDLSYVKKLFEELNIPGFMLDGALDMCRVALKAQKPGETLDFSYPCQTMYEFAGVD